MKGAVAKTSFAPPVPRSPTRDGGRRRSEKAILSKKFVRWVATFWCQPPRLTEECLSGSERGFVAPSESAPDARIFCPVKFFGWIAGDVTGIILASNETTQRRRSQGKCFGAEACVD